MQGSKVPVCDPGRQTTAMSESVNRAATKQYEDAIPASTTESSGIQMRRFDAQQGGKGHLARRVCREMGCIVLLSIRLGTRGHIY